MDWQIGAGVIVVLVVLAWLVARARPGKGTRRGSGDGAQAWLTGSQAQRGTQADQPGGGPAADDAGSDGD